MVSAVDYLISIVGNAAALLAVGLTFRNREATRYLVLNIYLLACVALSAGEWFVIRAYGLTSFEYIYFYYYSESFLSVLLYFVLMGFYKDVYEEIHTARKLRLVSLLGLAATAWVSFTIVQSHKDHMTTRFVLELSRDLNFLGLILTYVLWSSYMRGAEQSKRLLQLISALGIYFSLFAIYFGVRMTTHSTRLNRLIPPVLGCWLPIAWTYAFARIPRKERARESIAEPAVTPGTAGI